MTKEVCMKKWYYKLKESENWNVLIGAVFVLLMLKLLYNTFVLGINVWQMIEWAKIDGDLELMMGSRAFVAFVFTLLAVIFAIQAVIREPKMIIGTITSLAVVAVISVSLMAVFCAVLAGCWLWRIKRAEDKPLKRSVKCLIVIAVGLIVAAYAAYIAIGIASMGYWTEWGPVSLDEGDWSEWTTQDEEGNIVHIDGDGNGSTYKQFEFE